MPFWLIPRPFVFLPVSVSPFTLKLSQASPPLLTFISPPVYVPANAPLSAEPGLELPGILPFRSIFNFSAIIKGPWEALGGGAGSL